MKYFDLYQVISRRQILLYNKYWNIIYTLKLEGSNGKLQHLFYVCNFFFILFVGIPHSICTPLFQGVLHI